MNGASPGTSTAQKPYPRRWMSLSMRWASASLFSRLSVAGKYSITAGSAFIAANGSRSCSRHGRSSSRSVLSCGWEPTCAIVGRGFLAER
jgi:hypothetical protein